MNDLIMKAIITHRVIIDKGTHSIIAPIQIANNVHYVNKFKGVLFRDFIQKVHKTAYRNSETFPRKTQSLSSVGHKNYLVSCRENRPKMAGKR